MRSSFLKNTFLLAVSLTVMACSQTPTPPQPSGKKVYASSGEFLYHLDVGDGSAKQVGAFENAGYLLDLARSPVDQKLYGVTSEGLYGIDPNTGKATLLSIKGFQPVNSLAVNLDGRLWGVGGKDLYRIDLEKGLMEKILTLQTSKPVSGDLVFHKSRTYVSLLNGSGTDVLAQVNVTGEVTELGDIGFREVYGLTVHEDQMYGVTSNRDFLKIDLNTGKGTRVGPTAFSGTGLE